MIFFDVLFMFARNFFYLQSFLFVKAVSPVGHRIYEHKTSPKLDKTKIKIIANAMHNLFLYFTSVPRMASKENGIILKFIIGKVNICVFDIIVCMFVPITYLLRTRRTAPRNRDLSEGEIGG